MSSLDSYLCTRERESMIFKGELDINSSYKYQAKDAATMYEYHCDDHTRFQENVMLYLMVGISLR